MTAGDKIKQKLIHMVTGETLADPEAVRNRYLAIQDDCELSDSLHDIKSGFRSGTYETGIECDWSRHYESKAVATQMLDGSWVGWTYWYGGGKHGEPGAIEWIDGAYDVTVREETRVVKVFEKADQTPEA